MKRIEFILTKVAIDTSTLATNGMDSQSIREINWFSPILDHSHLFQGRCGDHLMPQLGFTCMCLFLKQQRRHSFQAFFVCCCCAAHLQGRRFSLGIFGVLLLMFSLSSVWRWDLWNSMSWTHGLGFWSACWNSLLLQLWLGGLVGFGLSTYLASFFGGFLLPLRAFCVLSLSLVCCTPFLTQETHLPFVGSPVYFRGLGQAGGGLGSCCSSCVFLEMGSVCAGRIVEGWSYMGVG